MTATSGSMNLDDLNGKISSVFGNLVIDKRRLPESQLQKRSIPGYVAEWVLDSVVPGVGPLSTAEAEKVHAWASRVIPSPSEKNLIKDRLIKGEAVKILTPVEVEVILTRQRQERVAKLTMLGINDAFISEKIIEQCPDLLKRGMWGITELVNTGEGGVAITSFKPMQATVDIQLLREARGEFTLAEWRALLLQSMGYNPNAFKKQEQSLLLCRLLPLVQRNMHLIELAPKGTGKSYIYENISPMVRLISGGNVSPAVLFVNNTNGQEGLLVRYSVVVLDEVQTLKFEKPGEIVGGLKGYLANDRITRGGKYEMASDCGLVLLANISLDDQQRPLLDPVVQELPAFMQETAFIDRFKGMIPGWDIRKLGSDCFATGLGFKADFFGDTLIALRNDLTPDHACARAIALRSRKVYGRNEKAIQAIASGMQKLLFPHGEFTNAEFYQNCLMPAIRLRQLIWDQLYSLDSEYRQFEHELRCDYGV